MTTHHPASDRLARTLDRIDEANARDPRRETWEGTEHPKEWLYGRRMSEWLVRLDPAPSEALQVAVRAQHLRRWEHPRSDYPEGRAGYLRWRTGLYGFHAAAAGEIMRAEGYGDDAIDRVRALMLKSELRTDAEAATMEDCACLVFLQFHFEAFAREHDTEKVLRIVRKTWEKMSPAGRDAAGGLALSAEARDLLGRALGTV